MKSYRFHIAEMHCDSCTVLTELELSKHSGTETVHADLSTKTVDVTGDFGAKTPDEIAEALTERMRAYGYTVAPLKDGPDATRTHDPFPPLAFPIAAAVIALALILQNSSLADVFTIGAGSPSLTTALMLGFIASLSSCGAIVGGIALSLAAHYTTKSERLLPQISFHLGRIIAFFVLGGILGTLGTMFTIGFYGTATLKILIALLMIILGLHVLNLMPRNVVTLRLPLADPFRRLMNARTVLAPFLIGALTFFCPCGFTQSAQLYTLTLGSFHAGALFMGAFALGTLPVLALISFLPSVFRSIEKKHLFTSVAGLLVITFALSLLIKTLMTIV